jgi:tRNA pseudouridine38-40 synthase
MMRTIKLTIAYDGTHYAGWQVQKGQTAIQEVVEKAIAEITGQPVRAMASGRTDAGVHALAQVVSFRTSSHLSAEVFCRALNSILPRDIAVLSAGDVAAEFHPTKDVVRKRYRYVIHDGAVRDVFRQHYCWHFPTRLDAEAMQRALSVLIGKHDFSSFETSGSERQSSVRTIYDIQVRRGQGTIENDLVTIEVEADGFLYNMVRTIVGSAVEVGRGARGEQWIAEVLAQADRRVAGKTAPPQGLFMVRVDYGTKDR